MHKMFAECDITPLMYINRIGKLFHDRMRKECEKMGISSSYRQILFHLAHEDGITQLDLVKRTFLKAPSLSVTLKKMESDGLITRKIDDIDMRQVRISLTDKGIKMDNSIKSKVHEIETLFMDTINKDDIAKLNELLNLIHKNALTFVETDK